MLQSEKKTKNLFLLWLVAEYVIFWRAVIFHQLTINKCKILGTKKQMYTRRNVCVEDWSNKGWRQLQLHWQVVVKYCRGTTSRKGCLMKLILKLRFHHVKNLSTPRSALLYGIGSSFDGAFIEVSPQGLAKQHCLLHKGVVQSSVRLLCLTSTCTAAQLSFNRKFVFCLSYVDRLKINRLEDRTSLCLVKNENFLCYINVFSIAHQPTVQGSYDHSQMTSFSHLEIR